VLHLWYTSTPKSLPRLSSLMDCDQMPLVQAVVAALRAACAMMKIDVVCGKLMGRRVVTRHNLKANSIERTKKPIDVFFAAC
jgi:hypothetical protein